MPYKSRHTEDLLKGRLSIPGGRYFLTWVTDRRAPVFSDRTNRQTARICVTSIDGSGDGSVMAANIMPDHIHLLLELGSKLSLSEVVAKTKAGISRGRPELKWQLNFFDHQLRTTDSEEDYAFYIFMNPYCAGICSLDETWSGWIPSKTIRWAFEEKLRAGQLPQPEWIERAKRFGTLLPRGAD